MSRLFVCRHCQRSARPTSARSMPLPARPNEHYASRRPYPSEAPSTSTLHDGRSPHQGREYELEEYGMKSPGSSRGVGGDVTRKRRRDSRDRSRSWEREYRREGDTERDGSRRNERYARSPPYVLHTPLADPLCKFNAVLLSPSILVGWLMLVGGDKEAAPNPVKSTIVDPLPHLVDPLLMSHTSLGQMHRLEGS